MKALAAPLAPPGSAVAVVDAVQRLQLSRQRLRLAMRPAAADRGARSAGLGAGQPPAWLALLRANPAGRLVADAIESWWAQNPLRLAAVLLGEGASCLVAPAARRHPWALVLGGLVLGAAVVKLRPWRWIVRPAVLVGMASSMASGVIARLPAQSWLAIIAALTRSTQRTPSDPAGIGAVNAEKTFSGL
jgi:hypothetical protein